MITDNDVNEFRERILKYHHGILFDEWEYPYDKESLGYFIEALTNIDSKEEIETFYNMIWT